MQLTTMGAFRLANTAQQVTRRHHSQQKQPQFAAGPETTRPDLNTKLAGMIGASSILAVAGATISKSPIQQGVLTLIALTKAVVGGSLYRLGKQEYNTVNSEDSPDNSSDTPNSNEQV